LRVIGRVHAGWTFQNEFEDLPPSVRFFAGGDNSVRGYGYEELGPEQDGEVVGGRRLLTGSLEFDVLLRPNWSVAAFVDSGSAFNTTPDFSTGVGLGLRWYSPLGPLRFDLAHPLDDPDRSVRLHISLGPDL
jgi:translocation and assembly module TamA